MGNWLLNNAAISGMKQEGCFPPFPLVDKSEEIDNANIYEEHLTDYIIYIL